MRKSSHSNVDGDVVVEDQAALFLEDAGPVGIVFPLIVPGHCLTTLSGSLCKVDHISMSMFSPKRTLYQQVSINLVSA